MIVNKTYHNRAEFLNKHLEVLGLFSKPLQKMERAVLISLIMESSESGNTLNTEIKKKVRIKHNLSLASMSNYMRTYKEAKLILEDSKINTTILPKLGDQEFRINLKLRDRE